MTSETRPALGVDVGTARVGVAITDDAREFVFPCDTFAAAVAIESIVALVRDRHIAQIVVGWPLELDGTEGRAVRRVATFIEQLELALVELGEPACEVVRWDERLTTSAAAALLDAAGVHGRRRKDVVDQAAAIEILDSWLAGQGRA